MKTILTLLLVAAACVGCRLVIVRPTPQVTPVGSGVTVQFAWDPSVNEDTNLVVTNYVVYVHTNNLHVVERSESAIKINAGTNLTAFVYPFKPGNVWYAAVSAQATYTVPSQQVSVVESELSNMLIFAIPNPPQNNRVVIEYSLTLTNFSDAGYFRLRIQGPPSP